MFGVNFAPGYPRRYHANSFLQKATLMRKTILTAAATLAILACIVIVTGVRNLQQDAARSRAGGRLGQLRLSIINYETTHGQLPARCARDTRGKPTMSWLASVLPQLEKTEVMKRLDTAYAWNAPENAQGVSLGQTYWEWYRRDGFFPCALQSDDSIWTDGGDPRGRLSELPNSIVLVSVAVDNVHPLQPFVITEAQLKRFVLDGSDALFIATNHAHGKVTVDDGKLVFER